MIPKKWAPVWVAVFVAGIAFGFVVGPDVLDGSDVPPGAFTQRSPWPVWDHERQVLYCRHGMLKVQYNEVEGERMTLVRCEEGDEQ